MKLKNKTLLVALIFILLNKGALAQKTETLNTFNSFLGKEVYELLLHDSIRSFEKMIFFDEPPGQLRGALIVLDENNYLQIYISNFEFLDSYDEKRVWNKSLFYKEKINRIKAFEKNNCISDIQLPPNRKRK